MKLLYRGEKYRDESFPDYVARLAYWNGFGSSRLFVSKLCGIYQTLRLVGGCHDSDESKVGAKRKRPVEKWYECKIALEFILGRYFDYSEMNIRGTRIRKTQVRNMICAACWSENPYVRFYWRDRLYDVCHKHDALLKPVDEIPYGRRVVERNDVDLIRFAALGNCVVTKNYLSSLQEMRCTRRELERERKIAKDESVLWMRVVDFLKERFLVNFGFDNVFERIDRASLAGLPIVDRIEQVRGSLTEQNVENKKLINVIILAQIVKRRLFSYSSEAKLWLFSEAYSVHPVFYFYIAGVGKHLFSNDGGSKESELSRIYTQDFSDRMLCKFILESSIFTPFELDKLNRNGKDYSAGGSEAPGMIDSRTYNYKKYLEAAGSNIFDREPLPRAELAELS